MPLQTPSHSTRNDHTSPPPPQPTLLTFTPPPTYTLGRRDVGTLTQEQIAALRGISPDAPPLPLTRGRKPSPADFHESQRGGQTTFHGPGQLVAFLICDLRAHGLSPRAYIRLLEDAVVGTLSAYGLRGHTTENPGVWIGDAGDGVPRGDDRKVASVGVHLRRSVSSFGVGVNAGTDLGWFERIVMCGLPARRATNMEVERGREEGGGAQVRGEEIGLGRLGEVLAREVAGRVLGVGWEVEGIGEGDVWEGDIWEGEGAREGKGR